MSAVTANTKDAAAVRGLVISKH